MLQLKKTFENIAKRTLKKFKILFTLRANQLILKPYLKI